MDNKKFIRDYSFTNTDARYWNLFNENGVLYSYGYHYPLLFKVNWIRFVNTRGYSSTTRRHIGMAWLEAEYEVKLNSHNFDIETIKKCLQEEKETIIEDIANCKRKVSQKKDKLFSELNRVVETMEALKDTEHYRA